MAARHLDMLHIELYAGKYLNNSVGIIAMFSVALNFMNSSKKEL
jgi:hypothetical protein